MFNFLFSLPPSITKPHKSASQYPYKVAGTDIKDQNFLWFLQLINIQKKIKFITNHLRETPIPASNPSPKSSCQIHK